MAEGERTEKESEGLRPNRIQVLLALGTIGLVIWQHISQTDAWYKALASFMEEAGVLCAVFGIIEHYLDKSKRWTWRNFDVAFVGVALVMVGVMFGSCHGKADTTPNHEARAVDASAE